MAAFPRREPPAGRRDDVAVPRPGDEKDVWEDIPSRPGGSGNLAVLAATAAALLRCWCTLLWRVKAEGAEALVELPV